MDKENTAKFLKVEIIYTFKADGTYVENVKVLDGSCEGECGEVVTGTYSATEGSFTLNQKIGRS
ncbi:MAG: hypothetical protein IPM97_02530 [Bdellovibrionaceae bacterium]|nr:hypothetical protein [Pseudobdellovibrionaceae bacterium]